MKQKYSELVEIVLHLHDDATVIDFFEGFFTPQELAELLQRIKIVKLLKQGKTQREIVEKLGVGIATVTRGSKELQKGRFSYV